MSLSTRLDTTVTADAVVFALTVTNDAATAVDIQFRSGKHADVTVSEDGDTVWQWSAGRMFTQALDSETLAPGESITSEMTWENPPPGEYVAEAALDAATGSLVERKSFTVS